ncbi:MAG TPA: polysaccharide deacetylase family protein [Acidothermaceae bacterium]
MSYTPLPTRRARIGSATPPKRWALSALALLLAASAAGSCTREGPGAGVGTSSAPSAVTSSSAALSPSASPTSPVPPTSIGPGTPTSAASSSASPATTSVAPATTARPSGPALPSALVGVDVTKLPTAKRIVALTFDAGGNADGIPKILATLRAKQAAATFFLTGSWVESFPAQARALGAQYAVGDHSMTHPHFSQLSDNAARAEVEDARAVIRAATGLDPRPLFRFPFGERDAHDRALVNALGYVSIGWTVDTLGWQGTSAGRTAESVRQRVLAQLQPGEIVLMHVGAHPTDRSTLDADALAGVIDAVRAAGYGFVTLPAGLGLS